MTSSKQPNVLLIVPDAMQGRVVDPDCPSITPNFDRVAQRGVRFTRAHTSLPTCSPARASLMTGLLPHNHGVLQVEHCVDDDQSILRTQYPHWAQHLTATGYHTGYFGKWHVERTNRLEDFGWQVNGCNKSAAFRAQGLGVDNSDALVENAHLVRNETGPEGYRDILHYAVTNIPSEERDFAHTTRLANQFLNDATKQDKPFACVVSFPEPNTPLVAGRKAFEQYDVDAMPLPTNLRDDHAKGPAFYRRQLQIQRHMTDRDWREMTAVYFALVTELDQQVGLLLDTLEQADELDNTVVVVTSDHGRYVGAHGYDAHNFGAYEEIYRIPMVIAAPDAPRGATCDGLVSLMDVGPTLLDLAAAAPLEHPDSRSFASLLTNPQATSVFDTCYAEYHGTRFPTMQRVAWHGPWKYVFNGFDYDEMYNLDDDPHELNNLANDTAYADQAREMMKLVWSRARDTGDQAILQSHYSPMRFAVVGPEAV